MYGACGEVASGKNKVIVKKEKGSARILLNNPPLNVIDTEVLQDLVQAISELEINEEIDHVTIGSNLKGVFSVGFDTSCVLIRMEDRMNDIFTLARSVSWLIRSSEKLYSARINGLCLGLALEIVLSCDAVVYDKDTRIGNPEIRFGMPFLTGVPWNMFSHDEAGLMLSGRIIEAGEAEFSGFIPSSALSKFEKNFIYARRFYKRIRPRETSQVDGMLSMVYDLAAIDLKGLERFREVIAGSLNIPLDPD